MEIEEPFCPVCNPELLPSPGNMKTHTIPWNWIHAEIDGDDTFRMVEDGQSGPDGWLLTIPLDPGAARRQAFKCPVGHKRLLRQLLTGHVEYGDWRTQSGNEEALDDQ